MIVFLTLIMFLIFSVPVLGEDEVKIIINKKINKLAYLKNGVAVKIFPVATGRSAGLTPEGSFKVIRKLVNPYYSKENIAGGSPRNPLGVRWLGLNALGTPGNTYGIHGTNNPKSIGRYASGGCIRMQNKDVIWLYQNTPLFTVVEIINKEWDLEQKPITVMLNGENLAFIANIKPYMINNRVMVPCRILAESIGCIVSWDSDKRQVTMSSGRITVTAAVGSKQVTVNGQVTDIDEPVSLKNDSVYIPVRAFAEAFGFTVTWEGKIFTVNLVNSGAPGSVPPVPGGGDAPAVSIEPAVPSVPGIVYSLTE